MNNTDLLPNSAICCINGAKGCPWRGEASKLRNHLNLAPKSPERLVVGCQYAEITCPQCSQPVQRNKIVHHQNVECHMRPFTCEYCKFFKSNYDQVVNVHWTKCNQYPTACPYGCGETPARHSLEEHKLMCQKSPSISCANKELGCEWTGKEQHLVPHLNVNCIRPGSRLKGCDYVAVECLYCMKSLHRHQVHRHEKEVCAKRPFSCGYSGYSRSCNYTSTYEDVVNNHLSLIHI